jgi:hypothetical protein
MNRVARSLRQRWGLGVAMLLALSPLLTLLGKAAPAEGKPEFFEGNVVPLAELVAKIGSKLDADAAPHWLALVTKDGKTYPLIKDDGSRMFFKDATLLKRPMRLTGRLLPGTQLLQVVEVHSYRKGELHDIFYWCEICSIKRFEQKICDCCGGPMELREEPVKK